MSMRRLAIMAAALALAGGAAHAQDADGFASALAGSATVLGQAIGVGESGHPGVLVTGIGHAKLESPPASTFEVNVEGQSASAVQAAAIRDERLRRIREVAQRFGVELDVGESAFSMEVDTAAQAKRMQERATAIRANPGIIVPMVDNSDLMVFVARTGLRFSQPSGEKMAAFLDALKAAGVEDLSTMLGGNPAMAMWRQTFQVLGFGSVGKVDDSIWDKASTDAMANARRQAQQLATAAGRQLGQVEQVVYMTRSQQGSDVTVAVSVRFAFAP
jgi:uncharacterized protein YggE